MSSSIREVYKARVYDECPSCEEGEGELLRTDDSLPYVECTHCHERTEPASHVLKWYDYEKAIRRWNLAVDRKRDERQWRMTGRERYEERTGVYRDDHVAGAGKESESVR